MGSYRVDCLYAKILKAQWSPMCLNLSLLLVGNIASLHINIGRSCKLLAEVSINRVEPLLRIVGQEKFKREKSRLFSVLRSAGRASDRDATSNHSQRSIHVGDRVAIRSFP